MKKFINANKEVFVMQDDVNHREDFIDKLDRENIHVVNDEYCVDYGQMHANILDAYDEVISGSNEQYFKKPTEKELIQILNDNGFGNDKPDMELATSFYYSDCVRDTFKKDTYKFLNWLDNHNEHFTYVPVSDGKVFFDLIEYHPSSSLENALLDDKDNLKQQLLAKWYIIKHEDGTQEKISVDDRELTRYMLEKYNAKEIA